MKGFWFEGICNELKIQTFQSLGLVNSLIGFNIISAISAVIRIRELMFSDIQIPQKIANWTSFLQYGVDSQLKLDIIEIGLTERISVLGLAEYLEFIGYSHADYKTLRIYLLENEKQLLDNMQKVLPSIAFDKTRNFFRRLRIKNIF